MGKKKRVKIRKLLERGEELPEVLVMGWVRTRRDSKGGFSFIEINDGSCLSNLQVIADHKIEGFPGVAMKLHAGSCIGVTGKLVQSMGKGQNVELQADAIEVYGPADTEEYPLQKKTSFFRVFAGDRTPASAHQYVWLGYACA